MLSLARKGGRYHFNCVHCCARLIVHARPAKAQQEAHFCAIARLETAPGKRAIAGRVFTAFSLTITNPGVFFGFLAIFGSMNAVLRLDEAWHRPATLVAGVIAGGLLWWLVLSLGVSRFRNRIGEKSFGRINRWTGVLIAAFGFALLMEALL